MRRWTLRILIGLCGVIGVTVLTWFQFAKVRLTNFSNTSPVARPRAWIVHAVGIHNATSRDLFHTRFRALSR